MAERLHAPWTALYVETPRHLRFSEADRDRIAECLRLAERLGAQAVTIPGSNVGADILAYAREHNFSHIVVGNPGMSWFGRLYGTVAKELIANAGDIPVHLVGRQPEPQRKEPEGGEQRKRTIDLKPFVAAALIVAAAVLVGEALKHILVVTSISLVFLTAVLAVAAAWGLWPSLL